MDGADVLSSLNTLLTEHAAVGPLPAAITLPGLAVGLMAAVGVVAVFLGLQRVIDGRTNSVANRLQRVGIAPVAVEVQTTNGAPASRGPRRGGIYGVAEGAASRNFSMRMARELAQADLKITVGEFLVLSGVLASVGALFGFALPIAGHYVLALLLLFAGIYGPRIYVTRRKIARQRKFNGQLADIINMMSGALQSGFALMQSFEMVAREGPQPSAMEFDRVVREVGLGLSPQEALANLVERMQSEDLDLFVTAVNVQREVGGNLVEVLDIISNTIRERVKLLGEVRVLTSQQQLSGYIIALLPVGLALILTLINPSYMLGVFTTTRWCGWTMVGCASSMIFVGFLIIRQIVNIKV